MKYTTRKNIFIPFGTLIFFVFYFIYKSNNYYISIKSITGIIILLLIAFSVSQNKKNINYELVLWGLTLQLTLGFFVLNTYVGQEIFKSISFFMTKLLDFTHEGTNFVFGDLGKNLSASKAFKETLEKLPLINTLGNINLGFFAFTVLPTVIFVSSLSALCYYLGILQFIVKLFAKAMNYFLKVSGAEALATTANIFIGQTEAPLLVRPYVPKMTKSELLVLMTGGMATVSGSVLVAFIGLLRDHPTIGPTIGVHLLTASVMAAPIAIVIAKIVYPELETPLTKGTLKMNVTTDDANVIDAAARGALEGLNLALNIAGMLIAFIALIALFNYILGPCLDSLLSLLNLSPINLSLEKIFSFIFFPIAYLMGVPFADCLSVATILGEKIVLNEFVAFINLGQIMYQLSDRSIIITSYAICGFANFSSIAIQLGGIGGMAPDRRHDLAKLGIKALLGGTLTSYINATVAGLFILN
jgi:CNT family concentrative nucleoside transporter